MFIPRLYHPVPLKENDLISLEKEISHYLQQVLRLKHQDKIIIFNGQGGEYSALLYSENKTLKAHLLAFHDVQVESTLELILGQSLVRGDRMDLVIQKATELGVTDIVPLIAQKSLVKLDKARLAGRLAHWNKIIISATEQCGRTLLPRLHAPISVKEWVNLPFNGVSLLFQPQATRKLSSLEKHSSIRLAIGPESGWSEEEILYMEKNGFISYELGPRILRTETAAMSAVALLQAQCGDLR